MVPVFPDLSLILDNFLINFFSTAVVLPALIVLRTLANLLKKFLKSISVLLSFFYIHYLFLEICDLSGINF